eukprot:CAMPEP_0174915332 /NCGR_PEP_ID=MMETSP1355-20121228/906_1 /TAXON_ID=464990 /ORGANISM="Hemiselmis tepida, Strain CCMP443" /LENGTH=160 /DNA_ID=CAMNT_0016160203 /DNA_START=15 /DNA_END=497 /DNA_ORIENTATION=+
MLSKSAIVLALAGAAQAFSPATPALSGLTHRSSACSMTMQADGVSRRDALAAAVGAAIVAAPLAASAEVEYPNVPFLGGSDVVDVNNANIRVYTRFPGMYPNVAGKIVKGVPYSSFEDMYNRKTFTSAEKDVLMKYKDNLTALEPAPEYMIDNFNNGLYR